MHRHLLKYCCVEHQLHSVATYVVVTIISAFDTHIVKAHGGIVNISFHPGTAAAELFNC